MNSSERLNALIVVEPAIVSPRYESKGLLVVLEIRTVSLMDGTTLLTRQKANMRMMGRATPIQ